MEHHRPGGRSAGIVGGVLSALIVLVGPSPAALGQSSTTTTDTTAPPTTTGTTTTTTTTTDPTAPTTPPPTTGEAESTTSVDPLIDEAPGETVPETDETVPPPTGAYGGQAEFEPAPVLWSSVRGAERKLAEAEHRLTDAIERSRDARRRRKELELRRRSLRGDKGEALAELEEAERVLTDRSIAAFVGADTEAQALVGALQAADHDRNIDAWIRSRLLDVALDGDDRAIEHYKRVRGRLDRSVLATVDAARLIEGRLAEAESEAELAGQDRDRAADELEAFAAGSAIYISGARFPIARPYNTPLIDSYGFPRMPGTPDEHWHEGIDLFAPAGTPLLAAERGVILRISTGRLGGLTFWLRGESGADWYYAHLDSYAPGLHRGQVVEAGEVLGFVGNTGNAVGTPPHLHLEIHPGGGEPINPYPLLKVLSDRELAAD